MKGTGTANEHNRTFQNVKNSEEISIKKKILKINEYKVKENKNL